MNFMVALPIVCSLAPEALEARRQGLLAEMLRQSAGCELTREFVAAWLGA